MWPYLVLPGCCVFSSPRQEKKSQAKSKELKTATLRGQEKAEGLCWRGKLGKRAQGNSKEGNELGLNV